MPPASALPRSNRAANAERRTGNASTAPRPAAAMVGLRGRISGPLHHQRAQRQLSSCARLFLPRLQRKSTHRNSRVVRRNLVPTTCFPSSWLPTGRTRRRLQHLPWTRRPPTSHPLRRTRVPLIRRTRTQPRRSILQPNRPHGPKRLPMVHQLEPMMVSTMMHRMCPFRMEWHARTSPTRKGSVSANA